MTYVKSKKYATHENSSTDFAGPGGLKLAEFLAEKMSLVDGRKMIDVGFHRGYQTCFLAREYGINIVGIDPGGNIGGVDYGIEPLMANARAFGVDDKILGIKVGVPDTLLPCDYFDYAYTTTCLEMIRNYEGVDGYLAALREIFRVLKTGGILGLGEPMCLGVPSNEIAPYCEKYNFDKCFTTIENTKNAVAEAGFTVLEHGYCEDADEWWREHASASDDPSYLKDVELMVAGGWLSFGYVIAVKK